jgi:hypothetical protein
LPGGLYEAINKDPSDFAGRVAISSFFAKSVKLSDVSHGLPGHLRKRRENLCMLHLLITPIIAQEILFTRKGKTKLPFTRKFQERRGAAGSVLI